MLKKILLQLDSLNCKQTNKQQQQVIIITYLRKVFIHTPL